MAQCKYCGTKGFFLSVDDDGLCKRCDIIVSMSISQHGRILLESIELVDASKKLDTRISRCDVIIGTAGRLLEYHEKGIKTTTPKPPEIIKEFMGRKADIIDATLRSEWEEVRDKAAVAATPRTRITQYTKQLIRTKTYKEKSPVPEYIDSLEEDIEEVIHQTQLNEYLDKAKKYEFKKQNKRALDAYYDALYFLRNDDIDDSTQSTEIKTLEEKILELGGDIS